MTNDAASTGADELVNVHAPEFAEYSVFVRSWKARVGEFVHEGDALVDVMVDTEAFLMQAPVSGVLAAITVSDGQEADSGDVIGRIRVVSRSV